MHTILPTITVFVSYIHIERDFYSFKELLDPLVSVEARLAMNAGKAEVLLLDVDCRARDLSNVGCRVYSVEQLDDLICTWLLLLLLLLCEADDDD